MKDRAIIAIACLGMATFGIVLTTLGASLHDVIARFGIDKTQAGALLALMSFCVLAASIVFGPIVDRRGYRGMLIASFVAIIAGLETIAFAPSLAWLRIGVIVTGFAGGLINGAANALVADVAGERRGAVLTFVGGFFGVGAVGVPVLLSTLAGRFPVQSVLAAIPGFALIPLLLSATTRFPPPKQQGGFPFAKAGGLLRDPILLLIGVILFLESGVETTVGGWATLLFAEELHVATDRAPVYLAVFWLGLMVTRWSLGLLELSGMRVLFASIGVALASSVALIATSSVALAATAIFFLGAGFAPVFPLMFGFVGDRYEQLSGTALSLVIAIALTGGMLIPYLVGVAADEYGLRASFVAVPVAVLLLGVLVGFLARRHTEPAGATPGARASP